MMRWLQMDGRIELADTGEPVRAFGVVADITERRILERKAQRLSERIATIQEEERRIIAQELHDSMAQDLVAASLGLVSLRRYGTLQPEEEIGWNQVDASLQNAMKQLRTASYLMHAPDLRTRHLHSSLRQYIDGFANRSGLSIEIRANPKIDRVPLRLQRIVVRIVQEALGNIYGQASASQASVQIRLIAERLHIVITDDGCGVECRGLHSRKRFRGIRARVREYAGKLRIVRVKPNGARFHAVIHASGVPRKPLTSRALPQQPQ
jgi:signal transduction histidine kinase